jgi:hypothetical protein
MRVEKPYVATVRRKHWGRRFKLPLRSWTRAAPVGRPLLARYPDLGARPILDQPLSDAARERAPRHRCGSDRLRILRTARARRRRPASRPRTNCPGQPQAGDGQPQNPEPDHRKARIPWLGQARQAGQAYMTSLLREIVLGVLCRRLGPMIVFGTIRFSHVRGAGISLTRLTSLTGRGFLRVSRCALPDLSLTKLALRLTDAGLPGELGDAPVHRFSPTARCTCRISWPQWFSLRRGGSVDRGAAARARTLLAQAIEAEVQTFLASHAELVDDAGRRRWCATDSCRNARSTLLDVFECITTTLTATVERGLSCSPFGRGLS